MYINKYVYIHRHTPIPQFNCFALEGNYGSFSYIHCPGNVLVMVGVMKDLPGTSFCQTHDLLSSREESELPDRSFITPAVTYTFPGR